MKEKEKLIKALKEIFDELETWISINDLLSGILVKAC